MNPPPGMVPRIPARTGRMQFGKLFLWRLQLGLSQSAVILDTIFDWFAPEQPYFYASLNELHGLAAETLRSRTTLLKAREELIRRELIILVNRSDLARGNQPSLYWRFMPDWAVAKAGGMANFENSRINYTTPSSESGLPFRGKMENFQAVVPQNREEEIRGRGEREPDPPSFVSDALRISLEHRIEEIRQEMARAKRKGNQARLQMLYAELALHQRRLGFTPDELPTTALAEPHPKRTLPPLPAPEDEQLRQAGARHLQEFMRQMKGELPPVNDEERDR